MGLLVLLGILVLDFALMIIIYNQNESEENTSGDVSSDTELTDSRSAESAVDPPSADPKNVSLGKEQVIKTVYRYKEVVKNSRKKRIECYHCNNTFKNSYYLIIIPVVIMMIFGIVIDTIILNLTGTFSKSIIPLIAVSWIMLFIAFLLAPFFIRYVKIKG